MNVSLTSNIRAAINDIAKIHNEQVPFATSLAVNKTAYQIQQFTVKTLLPEKFTLRSQWWKPGKRFGVNYFPSNKKKQPIAAIVNTLAPWMEIQETGGQKKPRSGNPFVGIPTDVAWPDKSRLIPYQNRLSSLLRGFKSRKSKTLVQGGDSFLFLRNGKPGVYVRRGAARLPILQMFSGKDVVQIKPRFGFVENAKNMVNRNFRSNFQESFARAVSTRR